MHENREISCTSWSTDQDRSAKAINRAADANVQEKSDCAVIPVNQPNNEGQPSAEVEEGRAQTQENIAQSHMRPTQSGKRVSQGLRGVRQAARERKQERFTALLHHLSVRLLRDSFYALKRQASPGVDGVTWQEYETARSTRSTSTCREVLPAAILPTVLYCYRFWFSYPFIRNDLHQKRFDSVAIYADYLAIDDASCNR